MRVCEAEIEGITPIVFGKYVDRDLFPKKEKESDNDYEQRTWRERCHYDEKNGKHLFIPGVMLKNAVVGAAGMLDLKIPGHGNKKYKRHFEAGVLVPENLVLPVSQKDVQCVSIFGSADGTPGGRKRVKKFFPMVQAWKVTAKIYLLDAMIDKPTFELHLKE